VCRTTPAPRQLRLKLHRSPSFVRDLACVLMLAMSVICGQPAGGKLPLRAQSPSLRSASFCSPFACESSLQATPAQPFRLPELPEHSPGTSGAFSDHGHCSPASRLQPPAPTDPHQRDSVTALAVDGDADQDLHLLGEMLAEGKAEARAPPAPAAVAAQAPPLMVPVPNVDGDVAQLSDACLPLGLNADTEGEAHARKRADDAAAAAADEMEWEPRGEQHAEASVGGHKRRGSDVDMRRSRRRASARAHRLAAS
jgi:hypothetical protein